MPGDADARVIAQAAENARRQAELTARHRDLTKPVPPVGSDGDSLRGVKGFENISDEILEERANFNLRDAMVGKFAGQNLRVATKPTLDIGAMSDDELRNLADATMTELETRMNRENRNA